MKVRKRIKDETQRCLLQEVLPLPLLGSPSPSSLSPALIPLQEARDVRTQLCHPQACKLLRSRTGDRWPRARRCPSGSQSSAPGNGHSPCGSPGDGGQKRLRLRAPHLQPSRGGGPRPSSPTGPTRPPPPAPRLRPRRCRSYLLPPAPPGRTSVPSPQGLRAKPQGGAC